MKRLNIKVVFAAFAAMLVMCVTVAVLSFALADENAPGADVPAATAEAAGTGTKTNIDYIILNSLSEEAEADTMYHIVEIGSSSTPSSLNDMVNGTDEKFRNLVINGNKTIAEEMAAGKIDYKYFSTPDINGNTSTHETALLALKQADFVYVSNDPESQYTSDNDFPEDIKLELANAVSARKIPFMIDSPAATQELTTKKTKTFTLLADDVFSLYGASRYTFPWRKVNGAYDPNNATDYFSRTSANSLYIPIHGNTTSANWEMVTEVDGSVTRIAKILTIKNGEGDHEITDMVLAGVDEKYTPVPAEEEPDTSTEADSDTPTEGDTDTPTEGDTDTPTEGDTDTPTEGDTDTPTEGDTDTPVDPEYENVYVVGADAPLRTSGYISGEAVPDCIRTESIDVSNPDQKARLEEIDYSQYDMVIIESGCKGVTIKTEIYSKLSGAMYGMVHIIYSGDLLSAAGGAGGSAGATTAENYSYVYDKAAYSSSDTPRYTSVLVTDRERTDAYNMATMPEAEADIVKIINNGSFRGIGGGDDSGNKYTVLELQPCYPIDTTLADKFTPIANDFAQKSKRGNILSKTQTYDRGFYYLRTDGVLDGFTSDEISYDGTNSISEMETTGDYSYITDANKDKIVDYYAWEVSKAKVAHATGLEMDQIVVVHMSTTEFAASKDTVLDNYDFVYIGGNNSSIKSIQKFAQYRQNSRDHIYNMYYHNGDLYDYPGGTYGFQGQSQWHSGAYGVLLGNDITQDKLEELQNYIAKGMPVVFEKKVTTAFDAITTSNAYTQTNIDPDSNMYKLLTYAKRAIDNGNPNVLWGFDQSVTTQILNEAEKYGTTYNGYVTVFGGVETQNYKGDAVTLDAARVDEADLVDMLSVSNTRPKVALTLTPVKFVEGNPDTAVSNKNLKFNFDITGSSESYDVKLYIDDDGNSRFSSEENVTTVQTSGTGSLNFELADDFFGPVYWKVEVVDRVSGASASSSGITKIKRSPTDPKDQINLLQIMPATGVEGQNGKGTLWFCTECQQSNKVLHGNRYNQNGKHEQQSIQGIGFSDEQSPWVDESKYPLPNIAAHDSSYKYDGNKLGVHNHNFGIVKYDAALELGSIKGFDDWTSNWADALVEDYEFNMTIITTREYEALCDKITNAYAGKSDTEISSISSDYLAEAADYEACFTALYNLLNGTWADVTDEDKALMTQKLKDLGATDAEITRYGEVQSELDDYLTELKNVMISRGTTLFDKTNYQFALMEMDYEMKYHNYYDFFSLYNSKDNYKGQAKNAGIQVDLANGEDRFENMYFCWRNAQIYLKYFYDKYLENLEMGSVSENGLPDMNGVFSIIVFGAAEGFADDDIKTDVAINALKNYMDNDGSVLLFHDTLTASGSSGAKMTEAFREYFGQDARYMNGTSTTPTSTIKTTTTDEYYLSTLSSAGFAASRTLCTTALTGRSGIGNSDTGGDNGTGGFMNKYTMYFPSDCEGVPVWDSTFDYAKFAASGSQIATDRAVQNNEGIVTMYPFTIDSQLMISATHSQAFALDVEDPDMTVWYSLSGGSHGTQSSVYAAEPRNGAENYFIYTYGSVTYCGAGHSNLTGQAKNNNDERRLLINIICNSVRRTAIGTNVKVFDHEAETNDEVRIDPDGNYYMKVDDMTIAPEFAYKATTDSRKGVEIQNVKIYYDLGYKAGESSKYDPDQEWVKNADGTTKGRYVLFFDKNYPADQSIGSGKFKQIDGTVASGALTVNGVTTTKLNLKPEYFAPYNNEYTYIVIAVTDVDKNGKTKTTYKRIQIRMKQSLYDLT